MKHPVLKFDENHKPLIEGDFEFEISEPIYDSSLIPKKKISFTLSVEMQQDLIAFNENNYDEMYDAIGEKLKLDFIDFIKNQPSLPIFVT